MKERIKTGNHLPDAVDTAVGALSFLFSFFLCKGPVLFSVPLFSFPFHFFRDLKSFV